MANVIKENKGLKNYVKHRRTKRILATVGGVTAVAIAAGGFAYGFLKDPAGTSVKIHGPTKFNTYVGVDGVKKLNATDNYGRDINGEWSITNVKHNGEDDTTPSGMLMSSLGELKWTENSLENGKYEVTIQCAVAGLEVGTHTIVLNVNKQHPSGTQAKICVNGKVYNPDEPDTKPTITGTIGVSGSTSLVAFDEYKRQIEVGGVWELVGQDVPTWISVDEYGVLTWEKNAQAISEAQGIAVTYKYENDDPISKKTTTLEGEIPLILELNEKTVEVGEAIIFVNGNANANLVGVEGIAGSANLALYDENYDLVPNSGETWTSLKWEFVGFTKEPGWLVIDGDKITWSEEATEILASDNIQLRVFSTPKPETPDQIAFDETISFTLSLSKITPAGGPAVIYVDGQKYEEDALVELTGTKGIAGQAVLTAKDQYGVEIEQGGNTWEFVQGTGGQIPTWLKKEGNILSWDNVAEDIEAGSWKISYYRIDGEEEPSSSYVNFSLTLEDRPLVPGTTKILVDGVPSENGIASLSGDEGIEGSVNLAAVDINGTTVEGEWTLSKPTGKYAWLDFDETDPNKLKWTTEAEEFTNDVTLNYAYPGDPAYNASISLSLTLNKREPVFDPEDPLDPQAPLKNAQFRVDGEAVETDAINLAGTKGIAGSVNLSITDKFGTPITGGKWTISGETTPPIFNIVDGSDQLTWTAQTTTIAKPVTLTYKISNSNYKSLDVILNLSISERKPIVDENMVIRGETKIFGHYGTRGEVNYYAEDVNGMEIIPPSSGQEGWYITSTDGIEINRQTGILSWPSDLPVRAISYQFVVQYRDKDNKPLVRISPVVLIIMPKLPETDQIAIDGPLQLTSPEGLGGSASFSITDIYGQPIDSSRTFTWGIVNPPLGVEIVSLSPGSSQATLNWSNVISIGQYPITVICYDNDTQDTTITALFQFDLVITA